MLEPPLAIPVRRPRCCLRCFTFLGINTAHQLLERRRASLVACPEVGSLVGLAGAPLDLLLLGEEALELGVGLPDDGGRLGALLDRSGGRSEEHTSELQS